MIEDDGSARRMAAEHSRQACACRSRPGSASPSTAASLQARSEIDESLITGETLPRWAAPGADVHAGTVNMTRAVTVEATATDDSTLLAEIRAPHAGSGAGAGAIRPPRRSCLAALRARCACARRDHVHWLDGGRSRVGAGADLCGGRAYHHVPVRPCAGRSGRAGRGHRSRLFGKGVIVKAADGLERLAEVDTVVFDKTGTLTRGEPVLRNGGEISDAILAEAASLAIASRHPYSRAVVKAARERGVEVTAASGVAEVPGSGLSATVPAGEIRLGSRYWVMHSSGASGAQAGALYFANATGEIAVFEFEDAIRPGARLTSWTRSPRQGYGVALLSGDREAAVSTVASLSELPKHGPA